LSFRHDDRWSGNSHHLSRSDDDDHDGFEVVFVVADKGDEGGVGVGVGDEVDETEAVE
jgi:hypothetical protein